MFAYSLRLLVYIQLSTSENLVYLVFSRILA